MKAMGYGLLLVGVQRAALDGATVTGADELRAALEALLRAAREAGAAIVHVKDDARPGEPGEPETPGWELAFDPLPGEPIVRKATPNAFEANPALADVLRAMRVRTVVVAGLASDLGVRATALGALERGFEVLVPAGAHATATGDAAAAERVMLELEAEGVGIVEPGETPFRG